MDMEHEDGLEAGRKARVKQLEAMVMQLERENMKLLNKVTKSAEKYREEAASSAGREKGSARDKFLHAESVDDLISLDGDLDRVNEDEWLFVSPAKPPTPSQKQVTPSQWLTGGGGAAEDDVMFSLDDVRKDLSFQISNAESMSPSNTRRNVGGTVSPLTSRMKPSNATAKRYLEQVRVRRNTPPPGEEEEPLTRQPFRPDPPHTNMDTGSEDSVPVVRWRRPVPPQDGSHSPTPEEEEVVSTARWKKPVIPHNNMAQSNEDVPVVRWKKPVIPKQETNPTATDETVPVARWKKPVVPQDTPPSSSSTGGEETVPVVKWKRPVVPAQEDKHPVTEEGAVPVIQWKRPVMPKNGSEENSDMSKRPQRQRNIPAKAITVSARLQPEEDEEMQYRSRTLPRPSFRGSGLHPPGGSAQSRPRHASAERPTQRFAGSSLRARSPSPTGAQQPMRGESHSPSPTTRHSPSSSPKAPRKQPSHYTPSPPRTLQAPPNKQSLDKSPSAPSPRKPVLPSSSSGSSPRGRTIPPSSSAPATQNRLPSPGRRQLPTPPTQRQRLNATSPVRTTTAHPRTSQSPQRAPRGSLAQPPSPRSGPASHIKPARHSAAPPSASSRQKNNRQEHSHDDDWLEGCF